MIRKKTVLLVTAIFPVFALTAAADPERDSARIASGLRSFSDQDWTKIAGDRSTEKYEIARGDTLWGISGRLFGDEKVWPKIWEINNTSILNPHMIEPGTALFFNSGSGLELPTLALAKTGSSTIKSHYKVDKNDRPGPLWDERTPLPSSEWKRLPRQSWENVQVDLPADIDRDGFDTRNRVYLRRPATGLELSAYVACAPINPLGRVEGSRTDSTSVYRGNEVTIQPVGQPLEVGATYSLLDPEPSKIQSDGREALSYEVQGQVKILGVQSGIYVGEPSHARGPISRGALLVPMIKRIERQAPVAGPAGIKGSIISDRRSGAFMSGQNKWVYIDRGTQDGAQPGMIFRTFQNQDPLNGKTLTPGEVFVQGDAQIVQGCETFSIGMFVWSRGEVPERYPGILLTDLADEKIRFYFNGEASVAEVTETPLTPAPSVIVDAPLPEMPEAPEMVVGPSENPEVLVPSIQPRMEGGIEKVEGEGEDWLDRLDTNIGLQNEEEFELLQLEKFQEKTAEAPIENPDADLPPPPDEDLEALPPAPDGELTDLPPPPPMDADLASEESIVEVPAVNPPTQSATAPTAPLEEEFPADEESIEGLTPL